MSTNHQKLKTDGLQDTMTREGLIVRSVQRLVDGAEKLNLRYATLGNPPVYDTGMFPWAREVEADWKLIRAELDKVLVRRGELPAFHEISQEVRSISSDRNWKTFFLCGYGIKSEEAIRQCPETWRILQKIPGLKSAMFSIFEPGKHLPPHRGPYNGVLRFHLGLIVPDEPEKIAIRIQDQVCHWQEGKALIFDDAYEHEAWNHSDKVRVVLFVDFEKPTTFPANVTNKAVLNLAVFTPFIREGYKAHKAWEKAFYGAGRKHR
ncbi:MAG: aspartyl/asparaginyl beta-hydroxylase domain-containing protein [Pararhizobium sp.]